VHTALYHGREIVGQFRQARSGNEDIHAKLMDRYPEVPDWWYGIIFVVNMALAIFVCEYYDINLPWWAVILAILMAAFFTVPIGIVTAIANVTPGLNIITEFVIGFMLPGRPIANVTFKTYGYISMSQAVTFLGDLKLGHYMKIPPRDMFIAQTVGTIIAGLVNLSTAYFLFWLKPKLCLDGDLEWTCRNSVTFYSASVIWGVIGPARMFGSGAYYSALMWFFLIGILLVIPFWLLNRRYPNSVWKYVHIPVILTATSQIPPAQASLYVTWFVLGYIFQFYLFRNKSEWWHRYNYVLSAAMDTGTALSGLFLFFAIQYWGVTVNWWGNNDPCTAAGVW